MSESIRAVDRALDVLACFTVQTPELSMTEISERIGVNKSTVHRLLATLEARNFVQRDPRSARYQAGIRLLQMAYLTLERNDLRRLAHNYLHKLSDQYRENTNLAILDGTDVVYVDVIEGPQRVKIAATPGMRLPAFSTASGKAILAFLPQEQTLELLARGMPKYTPTTLQTPESFLQNASVTRKNGFAISMQEYEDGINAIAAPVFDNDRYPVASISIAGPAYRLTYESIMDIGQEVVRTCAEISAILKDLKVK